jgi:SAM-dependent methyltransferase
MAGMSLRQVLGMSVYAIGAGAAAAVGYLNGVVGREFDLYGRVVGLRLLARRAHGARQYLLTPVSCVRYWEYDFARRALPEKGGRALDLSSPRLFSMWALEKHRVDDVLMCNPDASDVKRSQEMARALGLSGLSTEVRALDGLRELKTQFDVIWTISVLEHVAGDYDETEALGWIWERLAPGGRLIVTVPIDHRARDEYRNNDYYGTQARLDPDRGVFFQRWYDEASIDQRIIRPLGMAPVERGYYGECTPGHFHEYERRWMTHGLKVAIFDPVMMARHYREFASADAMPGCGVAGLVFRKPGG